MRTFFIHIPKTGGTTVSSMIRTRILSPWQWDVLPDGLVNYDTPAIAQGHVPYGVHERFPDRPHQYITVLRDPVERQWSHYYSVLRRPEHHLYQQAVALGPAEYMLDRSVTNENDNIQTRMISGLGTRRGEKVEASHFYAACRNLASFAVVGLTEHLRETMRRIYVLWGWGQPETLQHQRPGTNKPADIPGDVRAACEQATVWDRQLYDVAKEIFKYG